MKVTPSGFIAIVLFFITLVILLVLGAFFTGDPVIGPLFSLALASLLSVGAILLGGYRERLEKFARENIFPPKVKEIDRQPLKFLNSF